MTALDLSWRTRCGDPAVWGYVKALQSTGMTSHAICKRHRELSRYLVDSIFSSDAPPRPTQPGTTKRKVNKKVAQRRAQTTKLLLATRTCIGEKKVFAPGRPSTKPGWTRPFKILKVKMTKPKIGSMRRVSRVLKQMGIPTSKSTVHRDAKAAGIIAVVRPRNPPLSAEQEKNRATVFRQLLQEKHDEWFYGIAMSDEKIFDSNDHGIRYYYRRKGDNSNPQMFRATSQYPNKVMVWGIISLGWRALVIFDEDETVTAPVYIQKCIRPHLKELRGRILLQDFAPAHDSKDLYRYCAQQQVQLCPWSPKSCDANGIENVWGILARRVADRGPLGRDQLVQFIIDEWQKLDDSWLASLVLSLKTRFQAIVNAGGKLQRFNTTYKGADS